MSTNMGISGLVPMVAISGEDITEIHSITSWSHVLYIHFSNMNSWCTYGNVISTLMVCPPEPCKWKPMCAQSECKCTERNNNSCI